MHVLIIFFFEYLHVFKNELEETERRVDGSFSPYDIFYVGRRQVRNIYMPMIYFILGKNIIHGFFFFLSFDYSVKLCCPFLLLKLFS